MASQFVTNVHLYTVIHGGGGGGCKPSLTSFFGKLSKREWSRKTYFIEADIASVPLTSACSTCQREKV